ncbi:flippase activity-associated protein Agl23 [Haloglomus litoreum]|uniref:flippase activity-associated protein Agl23 n=1 Tax=Haloglomus litoreum TaxID=3034026 RepID=UPI0023E860BF|nr:flippase activity-associated protein Agl23 [Haloglomus sp. DT116]
MVAAPDDDAPAPDDGEGDDAGDSEPADDPADGPSASDDGPTTDPAPDPDPEPTPDEGAASPPSTGTAATDPARSARRPVLADYLGTGTERTLRLVLGITVLALVARLVLLGDRVQHFDEARVAWWTLEYQRTSSFSYRYIIHGPFIQHLNTFLFSVLGTTDFATRVVPALVGGLLPATALLFREHLRRSELVALALFLSFNPILLYYSRFSRSTILVAGFCFVAFGFLVRAMDARGAPVETRGGTGRTVADGGTATRTAPTGRSLATLLQLGRTRSPALYVHAAVLCFALAFAAKENALVYLLCWMGASALVADRILSTPGTNGFDRVEAALERFVLHPGYYLGHALLALVILGVVTLFFYAPRGAAAPDSVGLYAVLGQPGQFPALVDATLLDIETGLEYWFGGSAEPGCNKDNLIDGYACYLGRFLESMVLYAGPLFLLSVVGFLADRYTDGRPRALVMFAAFWGFASVLGYPLGTDIYGAWIVVNALLPLAIPAAVGAALLYRWGVDAYREDDGISLLLVFVLALVATGATGYQGATGVYVSPEEGPDSLVQYAQPEGEWRPILGEMQALSAGNPPGEDDVLVHGSYYVDGDSSAVRTPACIKWFKALPLPWYFEKDRMQVTCTNLTADLPPQEELPPVVISRTTNADALQERLGDDYRQETVLMRRGAISTVVFIDGSAPRADIEPPADTREAVRDARADRARLRAERRPAGG